MESDRDFRHILQKAAEYDLLSQYYKYLNPQLHMMFYHRHLRYMNQAVSMMQFRSRSQSHGGMGTARIRMVHGAPSTSNVDIYINGNRIIKDFSYKEATDYMSVAPGKYQIDIYPAGNMESTIISRKVVVEAGRHYILAAAGLPDKERLFIFEDVDQLPEGEVKLRFIHLVSDLPEVDIGVHKGDVVFPKLAYKQATNYLALSPMTVHLEVRAAGSNDIILPLPNLKLMTNEIYTILLTGNVDSDTGVDAISLSMKKGG